MSAHTCHHPHCGLRVPPSMLACRRHWFELPQKIRDAIWREYRRGQEIDKNPSSRYLAVQRLACAHWLFKPHSETAVLEMLPYVGEAMTFRKEAIAEGLGDPLEGLIPDHWPTPSKKKAPPKLRVVR